MEIIAIIHPFVMAQEFCIFNGEKYLETYTCNLENMNQKIYEVCQTKGIDKVHFHGGQLYALKFRDELISNKFGNKKIEVVID